jgi:hypothetical protein
MLVFNRLNENMNSLCILNEWNTTNMMCYEHLFHGLIFSLVHFYGDKNQTKIKINMMWA